MTLTLTFRMGHKLTSNVNMSIELPDVISYLMTIVMFVLTFTIYEKFANQIKYQV